jgi:hypothetical protein
LLTIIFVFDPLAIALVVAANFAFTQLKTKDDKEPEVKIVEKVIEVPVEVEKIVEKIVEVPVEVEKIIEKNVYGEEVEKKLKLLDNPRVQEAIKHAKRAGLL